MKVAVLTLPLHTNYGGNLQAWALMMVLKDMGHDAWFIDIAKWYAPWWRIPLMLAKRLFIKYALRRSGINIGKGILDRRQRAVYETYSRNFILNNIQPKTRVFKSTRQLKQQIVQYKFDAIVVGSDQVWRPEYVPNITDYFLGFLSGNHEIKRVAYAASFGTDQWLFTSKQAVSCAALLQQFDAVSVREDSGVLLCRDKLGVQASHVIDPTLLLDAEKYLQLLPDNLPIRHSTGKLFVYLLDKESEKLAALDRITHRTGFSLFDTSGEWNISPSTPAMAPPVENWIRGFRDAEFVFTDSFHACVFSLLFGKPFVAFGNAKRGIARFTSLLEIFGVQGRLVTDAAYINHALDSEIDWQKIEQILNTQRQKSRAFLLTSLR